MAKIAIKNDNIVPYGGIFYAINEFPGVMTSGPLVIGIENRQGNSNVKFEQVEEMTRMLDNVEAHGLYVRMLRADCGSFIKELVEELFLRTDTFYLRASSCADRRHMYEQSTDWRHTVVNGQEMDVASFEFTDFLSDWHLRLVVQRTKKDTEHGEQFLPGMEYMYRAILTNDHDSTEEQVIGKYNQRGASEKNFDVQNNDFGWSHLPFSAMEDNTVFLLFTAMLKNFYLYLLSKVSGIFPGIDMKSRLKRFVFAFIVIPAKWVRVARQWTLYIYTKDRWLHYWSIFNASYGWTTRLGGLNMYNPLWGKGELWAHVNHYMANICIFKKSHRLEDFEQLCLESFGRVAELRFNYIGEVLKFSIME